jgi:VanZ family protein
MIIAQEGTSLVLRLRTPQTNLSGMPSYQIDGLFDRLEWQRLDLSIEREKLQLTINGVQRLTEQLPPRALSVWASDYFLALGNEMTFDRPWLGEIRRAEVTAAHETINYEDTDLLDAPAQYPVLRNPCALQVAPLSCSDLDRHRLLDWLVNVIGFAPFGFAIRWLFTGESIIKTTTLASIGLSLSIEFGQIFVPTRFPSSEDLFMNAAGGILGGILAEHILCWSHRLKVC